MIDDNDNAVPPIRINYGEMALLVGSGVIAAYIVFSGVIALATLIFF